VLQLPTLQKQLDEAAKVLDKYGFVLSSERESWVQGVRERFEVEHEAA
jgi:hypothetical protein